MRAIVCVALALAVASCGGDSGAPARPAQAGAADALCAAHGVLSAVCPQCNPKLASIFQARGDWCAKHGFPESFCPTCHPERGGRPAQDVTPEAAPLDGTKVFLRTPAAVQAAGIEVEAARAPAPAELEVLATLTHDARRRAEVNPRLPGIVRELLVDVGTRVTRGTPLVRIESAEVGALQARLVAARARLGAGESARQRIATLLGQGMAAEKELLAAQLELDGAHAELATAESALGLLTLEADHPNGYVLRAPIDGVVLRHAASAGRMVDAADVLCEILDASVLWAELDVPEFELGNVQLGQRARVTVDGLPGREFEGSIASLAPEIDVRTRTAKARVALGNEDGLLRANMFARARVALAPSAARAMVPLSALQQAGDVALVFVQLAADRYEARSVQTGARRGQNVEILAGLEPGTLVATRGSFLLKTEVLKGSIGAGCCEVE